jgi:sugar O-acyltransferase (sialic acid O-acetyltransferase NeuD family)
VKEKLFLLGKSTFAVSIILDMLKVEYSSAGIIPNIPDEDNTSINYPFDVPTIDLKAYREEDIEDWITPFFVIGSIGKSRRQIAEYFIQKYSIPEKQFIPLIHQSSVIGNGFHHGAGLHISPLSVLAPYCTFGRFVVINRSVSIGHHTVLHDYVSINPGVTISGICEIGENTSIGAGATVIDQIKIGRNSIIGAGSVVTKNIPDNVVAYGSPAKIIREI